MRKFDYMLVFKRLSFAFLFYPFTRLLFLCFNLDYFEGIGIWNLFLAFIYGFRFDFSTMLIANSVFIIASVIPIRSKLYNILLKIIFCISNTIFLIVNIVDVEFFKFIGKKITFDVFDMSGDIKDQSFQLIYNYWYLTLLVLIISHILFHNGPKIKKTIDYVEKASFLKSLVFGFLILFFTVIGIRGGVQLRSLSPKQAFIFEKYELGNLALNSAYTMVRSIGKKGIDKITFFDQDKRAIDIIKKERIAPVSTIGPKLNVVYIILESFSQEYIDQGYAPFVSELTKKGVSTRYSFANGRRSLEALPSILTGMPSLLDKPIYQSQFQANKFIGLPQILKKNGYNTSFFHGGKRGTMDFDAYTLSVGVDRYYSRDDYPDQKHFDGTWGIFDHYYLRYFLEELNSFKEPFVSGIFTLSSHQPYTIPKEFKNKFSKGKLDIHESIGYVDNSLRLFFKKAKDKAWFKNTLFVITADHTQKLETKEFNNELGRFRVPIIFYLPEIEMPKTKRKIISHIDILPSVLDLLGIEQKEELLYGESIFSGDGGNMLNRSGNSYIFAQPPYFARLLNNRVDIYELSEELVIGAKVVNEKVSDKLKAYIQYTNNGLKSNKLYK